MAKKNKFKGPKKPKIPSAFLPETEKKPRVQYDINSPDSLNPVWQLSKLDYGWEHSWDKIGRERWENTILPFLRNLETMSWHQIKTAAGGKTSGTNSHNIPIERLSKNARERLEAIQQDDIDDLFSLRFTGKGRIWGVKDRNILRIIWFDFDHAICPMLDK